MEKETTYKTIAGILLFLLVISWSLGGSSNGKRAMLEDRISSLESQLEEYQYALEEANNNIEDANSIIEEAQDYAWSSYSEMGDVLDNLSTVDTVDEPY
ncbi:hypothetical protein A3B85_00560 [Candidatus Nomurabacteria bacterium RIFCSPHIGHO2_02_FULL_37_13]|uniref:Uncharacterized protein n=1 Tax=Candidatus Nomurabacteria bacterium RIFCSPHIGHO2_02_FULL_37_13 TaxID=1801750 RepID=A0A1F6W4S4_9BACT|nr:MAG: hypothetical protein A2640_01595 [Candidatus Nomurabacteria bacterium RIFCSPHIGHO2_01_FULL_36_23]OGI76812.1 MAG: hypothetical protein A3B85_00560 [Candidatus Nomurabacteria bacterium RIFCSPHIGHO2_02_FULL_37_13]OGI88011.1 MAG: hypothetical protein A2906_02940 [Candidatus Nomurabacteria bacterium RIFCSPLOWO2_01_FULL_37_25]